MALLGMTMQRVGSVLNFVGIYAKVDSGSVYDIVGRVRWRRRINLGQPLWWVKKHPAYTRQDLTKGNEEFLQEITKDIYAEKMNSVATLAPESSPLRVEGAATQRLPWTADSIRTGLVAKKLGTIPQWTKEGKRVICTMLQVQDNIVSAYTDPATWYKTSTAGKREGRRVLARLSIAVNPSDPQHFTAQYRGLFENAGVMPAARLATFAITPDARLEPGTRLYATHFKIGQRLTLWGRTKEHGFAGVMHRWGMKGGPADNRGCTKWHRRIGSIGTKGDGTVRRGKTMPGHMGNEWRPLYGMKLLRINTKHQVLYVEGSMVQGQVGNYIYVRDCGIWYKRVKDPPFPTHYPDEEKEPLPDDIFDPSMYNFADPTITFPEVEEKKPKQLGAKVKKQAKVKK